MAFPDLLQWLSSAQKTGTLVIDGPAHTKKVYFREGQVIAVASDNPREMLGYYLVGWGYMSEEDLRYLVEMQDHFNSAMGDLVVKMGHISHAELTQVMRVKTQETVYDLVQWDEGSFHFLADELPDREFLEVQLPVEAFLYEGHRQQDERRRMRELVPDSRHVPILIAYPEELSEDEMALAALIDGRRSIERIALECRLPEFSVLKFVYRCAREGLARVNPPSEEEQLPGRSEAPWLEMAREVTSRIDAGLFLDALKRMTALGEKYPEDPEVAGFIVNTQHELEERLDAGPVVGDSIIDSQVELDDLVNLDCDPAEGFVLSRINGRYSVDQVLSQLPGTRLNNRVILHNLLRRSLISVRPATGMARYRPVAVPGSYTEVQDDADDPFTDESLDAVDGDGSRTGEAG